MLNFVFLLFNQNFSETVKGVFSITLLLNKIVILVTEHKITLIPIYHKVMYV